MKTNKAMSKAYQEADQYRDLVNKTRSKILCKELTCVVYVYVSKKSKPCAIGYRGRAKKAAFHHSYRSVEQRNEAVAKWMASQQNNARVNRVIERQLVVGDVLRSSWGYDQTNIDYYKVIELVGKSSVKIVEIGQHIEHGDMSGRCTPDINNIIGKEMVKRADGTTVKIRSGNWARKIEPIAETAGVKIYSPSEYTSYR